MPNMDLIQDPPYTEEQLAAIRSRIVNECFDNDPDFPGFTCDDCPARYKCKLSFDPYNTHGDCLAEK